MLKAHYALALIALCFLCIMPVSAGWVQVDYQSAAFDNWIATINYNYDPTVRQDPVYDASTAVTNAFCVDNFNSSTTYGADQPSDWQAGTWVKWTDYAVNDTLEVFNKTSFSRWTYTYHVGLSEAIYPNSAGYLVGGVCIPGNRNGASPTWKINGSWTPNYVLILKKVGYSSSTVLPDYYDFTATPTSGTIPFTVNFSETSAPFFGTQQVWSFGDGNQFWGSPALNTSHQYTTGGNFSVSMATYNATRGWRNLTKLDYIRATNTNASLKTTGFQAYDGITHGALMGASIYIYDQNTGTWSNSTDDPDGLHYVTAYSDHILDGYATKSGYSQGQQWDVYSTGDIYPINLYSSSMLDCPGCGGPGDPGVGNVNLIVNVYDKNNGNQPVSDADVTVTPPTGGQRTQKTSSAGSAIFVVPNLSVISVTATKSGYSSTSDSITTTVMGPDTLSLGLTRFVATPVPTVTNVNGTVVTTVIPGCEDPTSSTCYAARDTEMANDVRDWIEILIPIAGVMTVLYLVGWKP